MYFLLAIVLISAYSSFSLPVTEFSSQVGRCDLQRYANKSNNCLRDFFLSFRRNQDVDCPEQFRRMKNCQIQVIRECFDNIYATTNPYLNFILNLMSRKYKQQNIQEALCEFNFPIPRPISRRRTCRPGFRKRAKECTKDFARIYRANRGDPALCKSYQAAKQCSAKALESYCDPDTIQRLKSILKVFMSDQYNPFCTNEGKN